MGAVHSSIDPVLLGRLAELLPLRAFVETGTAKRAAVRSALPRFEEVHAIAVSRDRYEELSAAFREQPSVSVHHGNPPEVMREVGAQLPDGGTLYWLHSHSRPESGTPADELEAECPLPAELDAIGSLDGDSVVIVDDARLFLSPPPPPHNPDAWPGLGEVLGALQKLSSEHELIVVDDVIVGYPVRIRDEIREHTRQISPDWVGELAARAQGENGGPAGPHGLGTRVASLEHLYSRRLFGLPSMFHEAKRRANRLERLRHHPPKPLMVPASYAANGRIPDAPTISIVTPSYNHARFLPSTIESVLAQDYPSLEYVVQDGGSEDGTREILEQYSDRLHHWDSAPDGGQTQALNLGFARTSGEVMAYLNSDDMLLPGTLDYVARYFQEHPEIDVVYGHRVLVDEEGQEIGRWVLPPHDDGMLSWADFVPQETLFWRRSAWERAGDEFDESFRFAMDWDALVRLRDAGARMVRLPRFLGAFRVHDDQKTTAQGPTLGLREMDRIRERLHGRPISQAEVLQHIRPYLIRHVMLDQLYRRGLVRY